MYPHMYIWLIGPPASGKSTAAEIGYDMLKTLPMNDSFSGEITRSRLISRLLGIAQKRALAKQGTPRPCMALFSDELGITVGGGEQAADFLRLMTQLYSGVYQSDTHTHSTRNLEEKVVLSWLACTTLPWLRRSVPADLINSGTVARLIAVFGKLSTKVVPVFLINHSVRQKLLEDLALGISLLEGEYKLSPQAEQLHAQWYAQARRLRLGITDDITMGIYGREDEHVMKVAMCLSAAQSDSFAITEDILQQAITLVTEARLSSLEIFRRIAVGDKTIDMKEYILEKIRAKGDIQQRFAAKLHKSNSHGKDFCRDSWHARERRIYCDVQEWSGDILLGHN